MFESRALVQTQRWSEDAVALQIDRSCPQQAPLVDCRVDQFSPDTTTLGRFVNRHLREFQDSQLVGNQRYAADDGAVGILRKQDDSDPIDDAFLRIF